MSEPMPYRGPCELCGGPDARHRTVDAIVERLTTGESADSIADDYDMPVSLVEVIGLAATEVQRRAGGAVALWLRDAADVIGGAR